MADWDAKMDKEMDNENAVQILSDYVQKCGEPHHSGEKNLPRQDSNAHCYRTAHNVGTSFKLFTSQLNDRVHAGGVLCAGWQAKPLWQRARKGRDGMTMSIFSTPPQVCHEPVWHLAVGLVNPLVFLSCQIR